MVVVVLMFIVFQSGLDLAQELLKVTSKHEDKHNTSYPPQLPLLRYLQEGLGIGISICSYIFTTSFSCRSRENVCMHKELNKALCFLMATKHVMEFCLVGQI